jgi:predicted MFS family arabinose efflux permease
MLDKRNDVAEPRIKALAPGEEGRRWRLLALLFLARAAMAFQFESVAALAPPMRQRYGMDIGDLGLLVSLYLAPGVLLAVPGGAIAGRYGEKPTLLVGLSCMVAGGAVMALLPTWNAQFSGRLVAGVGGVLLNVIMTKMVVDLFDEKNVASAMALFVNSWPVGIALALLTLPVVMEQAGFLAATLVSPALAVATLVPLLLCYRAPEGAAKETDALLPPSQSLMPAFLAGSIWGMYNAALIVMFVFAPSMLVDRGWALSEATSLTSLVLWFAILSVPAGALIADYFRRHDEMMIVGFSLSALALVIAAHSENPILAFVAFGLTSGLSAGPIMRLPKIVLSPEMRAIGMGVFYSVFYAAIVVFPWIAGRFAAAVDNTEVALDLGVILLGMCCMTAAWFWITERRLHPYV